MIPVRKCRTLWLVTLGACLAGNLASCRLDETALREESMKEMNSREKLYFLEHIQGLDARDDLNQAVWEASRRSHTNILKYLKGKGADLNRSNAEGWSPLLFAAEQGDLETLRYLIEKVGCDVRARTKNRVSALMLAADAGQTEVCRYLLERGANINARSNRGSTALMFAAASGNKSLVNLLLEAGADPRMRDHDDLHAHDHASSPEIADLLRKAEGQD